MSPELSEISERADVESWDFPSEKVRAKWLPRNGCFKILMEMKGRFFLQTVPMKPGRAATRLRASLYAGECPCGSGKWPVPIDPEYAVPAYSDWSSCRYASMVFPVEGGDPVSIRYHVHPEDAVMDSMDEWSAMNAEARSEFTVMACEIMPDFPVSRGCSIIWIPDKGGECDAWAGVLPVLRYGHSLIIRVTEACSALGAGQGEELEVVLRRHSRKAKDQPERNQRSHRWLS